MEWWVHRLVSEIKSEEHHLEYMTTVNRSATIMHIVNDVLDFSKKLKLANWNWKSQNRYL
jgi:hypothetical protein